MDVSGERYKENNIIWKWIAQLVGNSFWICNLTQIGIFKYLYYIIPI